VAGAPGARGTAATEALFVVGILTSLVLAHRLVHGLNANWDEFLRLATVHELLRGEPIRFFHDAYAHLFAWLGHIDGHELEQIVAARHAMLGLHVLTLVGLFSVARRFASRWAALGAVAAFLGLGYVAEHGAAFRHDPMMAVFLVGALALILRVPPSAWSGALAGAALGAAVVVTVKAALFLPAFAALLLLDPRVRSRPRCSVTAALTAALALAGVVAAAWGLHLVLVEGPVRPPEGGGGDGVGSRAADLFAGFLVPERLMPRRAYALRFVLENTLAVGLAALGAGRLGLLALRAPAARRLEAALALALGLPLLCLLVYRNAFPYFFVPLSAFAVHWVAIGLDGAAAALGRRRPAAARGIALVVAAALALLPILARVGEAGEQQARQRALLDAAHAIFPEPVRYLDRCGMVSSFPKTGFFMSSLGMERYHEGQNEALAPRLRDRPAAFVLANHPGLLRALAGFPKDLDPLLRLKDEDARYLRENYVHHWDLLFVAGKRLAVDAGETRAFRVPLPGLYTLEASGAVAIDGRHLEPGEARRLGTGRHVLRSPEAREVVLRFGERLPWPAEDPPNVPVFTGF